MSDTTPTDGQPPAETSQSQSILVSCAVLAGFCVLFSLVSIIVSAMESESAGQGATILSAVISGFGIGALLGALFSHFVRKNKEDTTLVQVGIPVGAGCGCSILLTIITVLFFTVLWPML
jgi:hypothetical protein